ncbi:MAG TPA: UDP-N-acetylmuramate--L-alanine ligase [Bacillota bacterium]
MRHLHFVGIGGARLRGLAKIYADRGYVISGSDWQESRETKHLMERGIKVYLGHDPANIEGADMVVYTNAVGNENPEVLEARKRGIPTMEGAELLGKLMSDVGYGIAIAGTHGKTTTSAMTSLLLAAGGLDPTVLIGGELGAFQGNHRSGQSKLIVVEACEFKRSFLKLHPSLELITNIDWDHPDCFPTLGDVVKTFEDFVALLPRDGKLVIWGDDPNASQICRQFPGKTIKFGFEKNFDWSVNGFTPVPPLGVNAPLFYRGKKQGELNLKVPGRHNIQNALGALAIATEMGVDLQTVLKTLADFRGVQHRFEIKGEFNKVMVVDDYAHHPGAIKTTLAAARQFFKGRIWCAFQPHLYSRTKYLLPEFAQAFTDSDILVLADIYPAREKDPGDISSRDLAREAQKFHKDVRYIGDFDSIYQHLQANLAPGDLLITMGAGDIWKVGERLIR